MNFPIFSVWKTLPSISIYRRSSWYCRFVLGIFFLERAQVRCVPFCFKIELYWESKKVHFIYEPPLKLLFSRCLHFDTFTSPCHNTCRDLGLKLNINIELISSFLIKSCIICYIIEFCNASGPTPKGRDYKMTVGRPRKHISLS